MLKTWGDSALGVNVEFSISIQDYSYDISYAKACACTHSSLSQTNNIVTVWAIFRTGV